MRYEMGWWVVGYHANSELMTVTYNNKAHARPICQFVSSNYQNKSEILTLIFNIHISLITLSLVNHENLILQINGELSF